MSTGSGQAPLTIQFTNKSSGTITAIDWDFGDGSHSSLQSPLHAYNDAGNYTAVLKVAGGGGATNKSAQIQVTNPPPPPTFKTVTAKGGTITFTWTTDTNKSYQVQFREDLSKAIWTNLGGIISATNLTMTISDTLGTARVSQRFYRVVLLP